MTARLMRVRSARRRFVPALAAVVMLGGGGCYEVAFFYPSPAPESAPGAVQGSLVIDGRRLGVASRLTGKAADGPVAGRQGGQAYIVLSVGEAYTASAEEGGLSTIIRVVASVVNQTKKPVRFEVQDTRLDCAGRRFGPKWTYRSPEVEKERFRIVAAGHDTGAVAARYDLYFDLGTYYDHGPPSLAYRRGPPDPHAKLRIQEGVPLHTIKEMTVTWKGEWGGEERSGEARFVRGLAGGSGGYPVPGPYWGGGWYLWADPWPLGHGYLGPRVSFWPRRWRGKVKLFKK